jgi:SAM-dependent methyltransferase
LTVDDTPERWDAAAARSRDRPYLDPLVGEAKRRDHLALLDRWLGDRATGRLLKTDLWEEGVAGDELLFTLAARAGQVDGVDLSPAVVEAARAAAARAGATVALQSADVRTLPYEDGAFDAIVSTSTLDHLPTLDGYAEALAELRRVLAPGGVAVVTADNRRNAFHWLLEAAARVGAVPFALGPAVSTAELVALAERAGLTVTDTAQVVPAPRVVATALVRLARAARGDAGVRRVLALFERLGRRSPERLACFVAIRATRGPA